MPGAALIASAQYWVRRWTLDSRCLRDAADRFQECRVNEPQGWRSSP